MLFNEKRFDFEIEGRKCYLATGKIARKSQSAVIAGMGDTVVLATVNSGEPIADADFFPMQVEYLEKLYAAGLISSSRFVKRERFPSDDAVLKARMIDRSIRSRFPSDYRNEVSIVVEVLSFDHDSDPVILAINAVSAALMISKVPFDGPISGVRVGIDEDGQHAVLRHVSRDPAEDTLKLNLVVAGDGKGFTNIDANAFEVEEQSVIDAMKQSLDYMNQWIDAQNQFVNMIDVNKVEYTSYKVEQDIVDRVKAGYEQDIRDIITVPENESMGFDPKVNALIEKISAEFENKISKSNIREAITKVAKYIVRGTILGTDARMDGRALDQIREMDTQVGILPRVHGSGLFTRGLTQILTIATLGTIRRQQIIEDMTGEDDRSFMHFYSDFPFTFGQSGKIKFQPGRREVGHGALAEKALIPVLPTKEEFPYTIILTSEIMSENGSSSQGSICASSLALMDAGVPIKKAVAGIACGLVLDEDNPSDFRILTDIRDIEDFYGFMDFKVAGTRDGVTAIQMDTKLKALPVEIFEKAIMQSRKARMEILDQMNTTIEQSRGSLSEYAPRVAVVKIPVEKIGELIGPGGKNIKALNERTKTEIEIEDDGTVYIFADNQASIDQARKEVDGMSFVPEVGQIYEGKVARLADFGAFVELAPGVTGLLHVSELSDSFVKDIHTVINVGEVVKVKVMAVDDQGKIKLSKTALNPKSE